MKNQIPGAGPLEPKEPCVIKINLFEGPLDLLLHLIKKNEMDIYDIKVAAITEQYIEYLELMKVLNLEVAGDYLVIAAELSLIKSKMLLPKPVIEEDEDDPRAELVKRLLEYQVYKDAASDLLGGEVLGRDVFKREPDREDLGIEEEVELVPVNLWSLIEAFREFYDRRKELWAEDLAFIIEEISLDEKLEQVVNRIRTLGEIGFERLFTECKSKFDLVITFLSLLELIRMDTVQIVRESPDSSMIIVYSGDNHF
jgi:segregation and condensation protein A